MNDKGLLTATRLKIKRFNSPLVTEHVYRILTDMDAEIERAHNANDNCAVCPVQVDFSFPAMKNRDAQLIVYYRIIGSLERRDFIVECEFTKSETIFYISWESDFDANERLMMEEVIAQHITKKR